jgi:nucleoside-diphosphate-sugar epimerase
MRVLITGAAGFVGHESSATHLRAAVTAALRASGQVPPCVAERIVLGSISATTRWMDALERVDVVLHLAARAHVLHGAGSNSGLHTQTNALGTRCLADAGARSGVRRFIYLSTVKVHGELTKAPISADDDTRPNDAYATSKWWGEQYLLESAANTGIEAVIVRSPLIYGPGVRANFLRLMRWVDQEWPLPLGAVQNRRSLVNVWNLCDLLALLLRHPSGAGRVWMESDGEDLSTPDLIRRLGKAMNRRVRLLPVAPPVLRFCGLLLRRKDDVARLCGSLAVDVTRTRQELGWSPPVSVDEGLLRTSTWYLTECRRRGV